MFRDCHSIFLTVTEFGGIYRHPQVRYEIRWSQVLFQKQVIAKSLFLDLLTREAGKASHMTVNLPEEPLFEGQTGLTPKIRDGQQVSNYPPFPSFLGARSDLVIS